MKTDQLMSNQKIPIGLKVLPIINFLLAAYGLVCFVMSLSWQLKHDVGISPLFILMFLVGFTLIVVTGIGMLKVNFKLGFIGSNVYGISALTSSLINLIFFRNNLVLKAFFSNPYMYYAVVLLFLINLRYKKYFILNKPVKAVKKEVSVDKLAEKDYQAEPIPGKQTYLRAGRLIKVVSWVQICLVIPLIAGVMIPTFTRGAEQPEALPIFAFGGMILAVFALIIFQFKLAKAINQHKEWAKITGIVLGVLWLFGFPIGTLLGSFVLYYLITGWE